MAENLEETKLDQTEETNLETADDTTQEGRELGGGEASEQSAEPSLEDRLAAIEKKNEDLLRGMNEAQRNAANLQRERDHWHQTAQAATGQLQQTVDPEAAATAQYQTILEEDGFVSDRALAARDQILEARLAKRDRNLLNQMLEAQRVTAELPQAQQMIQASDINATSQALAGVRDTITPTELAKIALDRQGTLGDWYQSQQQQREEKAKQAELLQTLGQGRSGERIPGSNQAPARKRTIDWVSLVNMPKATQRAIRADKTIEILNEPT